MGMEKMGHLKPWEVIVVENAPLGVEASVAAQAFTICVNTGHLPNEIFIEKKADIICKDMYELCGIWHLLKPYVNSDEQKP